MELDVAWPLLSKFFYVHLSRFFKNTFRKSNHLSPVHHSTKFSLLPPKVTPTPLNYTIIFMLQAKNNLIFSCRHCSCTVFILFSYSLYTQVILILVLINVPYLQIVVFTLDKGLNDAKFIIPPHTIISDFLIALLTVTLFGKP